VWLGLGATVLLLVGSWLAMRDERPTYYKVLEIEPRPRP
jgi:hypothetical protein